MVTDNELIHMYQNGSRVAATELMERYKRLIWKLASRYQSRMDREDLTQDLWVAFYENARRYDNKRKVPFHAYIKIMLSGKHLDLVRRWKRKDEQETEYKEETHAPTAPPRGDMSDKEVRALINRLPISHIQRHIVTCLYDGFSQSEIAAQFHVTRAAICYHVRCIRKLLRNLISYGAT